MTGFITNYIQNTAMGMLSSGITAAGNVAGNAVGGVGTMIQSSGQAVGTGKCSHHSQSCTFPSNTHLSGIEGSIKNWGNYVNSYGDRAIAATAPNVGSGITAVKKQKALPAPVKGAGAIAKQKALPAAPSSALKALPAPASKPNTLGTNTPSYAGAVKKTAVSAASKPKSAVSGVSPSPSVAGLPKPSVSKPSVSSLPPVNSKPLSSLPPINPKPLATSTTNKVKVSAASKPKTSGGLPRAPVDGLPKAPGLSSAPGLPKAPGMPKPPGLTGVTKAPPAPSAYGLPKVSSLPPANVPKPPVGNKVRIDPASKPKKY
jgi:PPE-repeat protein